MREALVAENEWDLPLETTAHAPAPPPAGVPPPVAAESPGVQNSPFDVARDAECLENVRSNQFEADAWWPLSVRLRYAEWEPPTDVEVAVKQEDLLRNHRWRACNACNGSSGVPEMSPNLFFLGQECLTPSPPEPNCF